MTEWYESWCCDPQAIALADRHYSRLARGTTGAKLMGPGETLVLVKLGGDAVMGWVHQRFHGWRAGVWCSIFRNESSVLSSALVVDGTSWARRRWPGQWLGTMVDPGAIESTNPGYCFKMAGWRVAGETKRGLVVLEAG